MPRTKSSNEAQYRYNKEHLKRIPLDVRIAEYELIKDVSSSAGMSVNGYIKQAIRQAMERDGINPPAVPQGDMPGTPGPAGESSE